MRAAIEGRAAIRWPCIVTIRMVRNTLMRGLLRLSNVESYHAWPGMSLYTTTFTTEEVVTMSKPSQDRTPNSVVKKRLKESKFFVGVDVHKRSYHVSLWNEEHGLLDSWVQKPSATLLLTKLKPYQPNVVRIVYEAGPTGFGLVRTLRNAGYQAEVIAPSKMLAAPGPEAKSDRIDSKRLAIYAAKNLLTPIHVPTEEQEGDRQIVRLREQIVRKSRSIQQQIKSFLLLHGIEEPNGLSNWTNVAVKMLHELQLSVQLRFCLDIMLNEYDHVKSQLVRLKKRIREMAKEERHRKTLDLLQTVPGVGTLTAVVFRTELVSPERFADGGQISRMLGLAPGIRQSGDTRREGSILRSGNKRLRTALVEAAWRWVAGDLSVAKTYHRLVANTGSAKKAIVAMARKLGIVLWKITVSQTAYITKST